MGSPIPATKVDPKFLHSNSTSHVWAFGAIAELIDNAYDPDVSASNLIIDKQEIGGKTCLVFQDNGNGMDKEHLYNMLSFGYCEKDKYTQRNHLAIGHYGNGFKSGSMRLGKDALVLTRHKETAGVGFLSQTYLAATNAETVFVPILEYKLPDLTRKDDIESRSSLKAILNFSVFTEEKDLINELKGLEKDKGTGTKIIIFNLHTLKDDSLELDFDSDLKDIRCRQVYLKDDEIKEDKGLTKSSKYKRSLREYCRILYLLPKMKITLRGTSVRSKLISKSLSQTEKDSYRPTWLKTTAQLIIGFKCEDYESEDYGLMMYHKNRLIKAYEKVGYQKQPNGMGVGVIGVAELNFLNPTHNKQDFNVDEKYNSVIKAFGTKLNDYWNAKEKENPKNKQSGVTKLEPDSTWVQCDECNKWRRMPPGTKEEDIPEKWFCHMNKDDKHNQCEDEEEKEEKDEIAYRSSYKKVKPQKQVAVKPQQNLQPTPTQEQENNSLGGNMDLSTSGSVSPSTSYTDSVLKIKFDVKEKSAVSRKRSLFQATPNSTNDTSLEDGQSFKKVLKPNGNKLKNFPAMDCTQDTAPSFASIMQAYSGSSTSLDKSQKIEKINLNVNDEKLESIIQSVISDGKSQNLSLAAQLPKAALSMNDSFSPTATMGRPNLRNQKKENPVVIDLEKLDSNGENKSVDFYKEKIEELKTKLNLKIRILDETEEKLRKFQDNVHRLLSLIVPGKIVGSVSEIEQNVEQMIKIHESESRRDFGVKDTKKKPPSSFLPSSSSDDVPSKDNQCCLS